MQSLRTHRSRAAGVHLWPRRRQSFLLCRGTQPASPCFPRTFIVPLRRAAPNFDPDALRDGRVDVGLRCVSSGLFRSQSLRQNSRVLLCFGVPEAEAEASSSSSSSSGPPRVVEVDGALVRDLRPDELSLAKRIRAVRQRGRCARRRRGRKRRRRRRNRRNNARRTRWAGGTVVAWRDARSQLDAGEMLDALKYALSAPARRYAAASPCQRPVVGDLSELASSGPRRRRPALSGGVVVLLGDDRGLSSDEEQQVLALAEKRLVGQTVSLGEDVSSRRIRSSSYITTRIAPSLVLVRRRGSLRGGGRWRRAWKEAGKPQGPACTS